MVEGSFEWALEQLAKGYWVRADYWSGWALYLYAEVVPGYRNPSGKRHILVKTVEGESLTWRSRPYDETAAHWVQVTHGMVCDLQQAPHPEFFWITTGRPRPVDPEHRASARIGAGEHPLATPELSDPTARRKA